MNALARRIARMIEMDGPISIGTYMTLALHDRERGFYATRESIGADGAFVTGPEISQIFGELIGLWCAETWRQQGSPARPVLVELGPGRATLIQDMLRALRRAPDFPHSLELVLVEASPRLQSLQRQRLADAPVAIRWVRHWSEVVGGRPVLVVANEFFDALPIRQFVMTKRGWCERIVVSRDGNLALALAPQPVPLPRAINRGLAREGAVCELCPAASSIAEEIADAIRRDGGAALFIDYGHDGHEFGDTFQAVRHHAHDGVLTAPGEADLSVHVDFSALADGVRRGGAVPHGPIAQAEFLRALGIEARGGQLARANPGRALEICEGIARLTAPNAMGTLFKVLAVTPREAPIPPGFP